MAEKKKASAAASVDSDRKKALETAIAKIEKLDTITDKVVRIRLDELA